MFDVLLGFVDNADVYRGEYKNDSRLVSLSSKPKRVYVWLTVWKVRCKDVFQINANNTPKSDSTYSYHVIIY